MSAGNYAQPFQRASWVQAPMVSGWVTARLHTASRMSGSGWNCLCLVTAENVGKTPFNLALTQTTDRTVSGTRTSLLASTQIVPKGTIVRTMTVTAPFVEVSSTSGSGMLRMQLQSLLQWDLLAFGKDDPYYPVDAVVLPTGRQD